MRLRVLSFLKLLTMHEALILQRQIPSCPGSYTLLKYEWKDGYDSVTLDFS